MASETELQSTAATTALPANLAELNARYSELSGVLPLPDLRTEAWHYGRPDRFLPAELKPSTRKSLSQRALALVGKLQECQNLTLLQYQADNLEMLHHHQAEEDGSALCIIRRIISDFQFAEDDGLLSWLEYLGNREVDRLEAESLARLNQLLLIELNEEDYTAQQLHVLVDMPEDGSSRHEQIVIRLGEGAALDLHLHVTGDDCDNQSLLHLGVHVDLADNARFKLIRYQDSGKGCDIRGMETQTLGRDSHCSSTSLFVGGRHLRHDVISELSGTGCRSIIRGLYQMGGRQTASLFSHQDHRVANAHSDLLFKGTMLDRSAASYLGQISVSRDAQGTDAYQSNRSLLLSPKARSSSSPQLEIEANDVRCSHGASVANVSAEELFYLESRGIDPDSGRQLLISGFLAEIADLVPEGALRDYVYDSMLERRV